MLHLDEQWFFRKILLLTSNNVNYYKIAPTQIFSVGEIYITKNLLLFSNLGYSI